MPERLSYSQSQLDPKQIQKPNVCCERFMYVPVLILIPNLPCVVKFTLAGTVWVTDSLTSLF